MTRWCRYSQADWWDVFLGLHAQGQTNEWTVKRKVKQIIAHRHYDPDTYNNDIALMELDANITLNQNIWPICLPSPSYHFPVGGEAWITGWGAVREGGECPRSINWGPTGQRWSTQPSNQHGC